MEELQSRRRVPVFHVCRDAKGFSNVVAAFFCHLGRRQSGRLSQCGRLGRADVLAAWLWPCCGKFELEYPVLVFQLMDGALLPDYGNRDGSGDGGSNKSFFDSCHKNSFDCYVHQGCHRCRDRRPFYGRRRNCHRQTHRRGLHGVGGNGGGQSRSGHNNAATGEEQAQLFHRAIHALVRRPFLNAENCRRFRAGFVFKKSQGQQRALLFAKPRHPFLQKRPKLFPNAVRVWKQLGPLLEEGMTRLSEKERTLLALRFFENKTGSETAAILGIQEWAAHKRVNRAVEKLRLFFTRRGVVVPAAALTAAIAANSVQAAPVGLAVTISATAVKGAAVAASVTALVNVTIKTIFMTTIEKTLVTAAIAAAIAVPIIWQQRA